MYANPEKYHFALLQKNLNSDESLIYTISPTNNLMELMY